MICLISVMFNYLIGAMVANAIGINPHLGAMVANGGGVLLAAFNIKRENSLGADVLKEIWIGKVMNTFYNDTSFITRSVDMTEFVEFNKINLTDIGADPNVLVNNNTYPVPTVIPTDANIALDLDTLDSENTMIRNFDSVQLSYPKMEIYAAKHRKSLFEKFSAKACHSYGPASNGTFTPVLEASGAVGPNGLTRLKMIDIFDMQRKWDELNVPAEGRCCILSPQHVTDLIFENIDLMKQWANLATGTIIPIAGFDFYKTNLTPVYNKTTKVKKAFGALAAPATDTKASVFFHDSEVFRADGTIKMFSTIDDPGQRASTIGFQKRCMAMPIRTKYFGAIISV